MLTEAEATTAFGGSTILGCVVGNYRGHGAFAHVFEAVDSSGRPVALKILDLQASAEIAYQQEFQNEGRLLQSLRRATGVVDLHRSGTDQIDMAFPSGVSVPVPVQAHVMERADGSLDELLATRHSVPWSERLHLFRCVVLGVHQMHLASIAHRDVKSSNCLLFSQPKNVVVAKVADLGRSTDYSQAPNRPPIDYLVGRGDLAFAPPEMLWLQGTATKACHLAVDFFGLASLFFELATGQGLTATALGPLDMTHLYALFALPEAERARQYRAALPEISRRMEDALLLFEAEMPAVLRASACRLIRTLSDPRAERRGGSLPKNQVGGSGVSPFTPVLGRIDSLIKSLPYEAAAQRRARRHKIGA